MEVVWRSKTLVINIFRIFRIHIMPKLKKKEYKFFIMSELTNQEALLNANVAPEQFDWDSFESGLDADARKEKK